MATDRPAARATLAAPIPALPAPSTRTSNCSAISFTFPFVRFVDQDSLERVDFTLPGPAGNGAPGVLVAGAPARLNPGRTEVDVLGMVLATQAGSEQPDQMHRRPAAVRGKLTHRRIIQLAFRQLLCQLADDMAQAVELLLPGDVAEAPAGVLDLLLAA